MLNLMHHERNANENDNHFSSITLAKIKKLDKILFVKGEETDTLLHCKVKLVQPLWGQMWLYLLKFQNADTLIQ